MSRLKIGSTTAVAASGENGTRFCHSRTVSQAAATVPAMVRAISTLTTTSTTLATGVRSGMSSAANVDGPRFLRLVAPPDATARLGRPAAPPR